ncbi:MAG: hypothetical protein IJ068_01340 [Bacilli bacterium]|nr:hypothetical protein [Bacilli bacterium]
MTYIYDILLNFNDDFYEFYEWEKNDKIYHIKKIPLFKVDTNTLEDIYKNKVIFNENFLNIIMNKTELFNNKKAKNLKYAFLLTDSYKVIGINIVNNNITYSDLLLDEACDITSISERINYTNLEYNIVESKNINYFETRKETNLKNSLLEEIEKIVNAKDFEKLEYLYFEYFGKLKNNENIYTELVNSLDKINERHYKLLELIKLSNKKKVI